MPRVLINDENLTGDKSGIYGSATLVTGDATGKIGDMSLLRGDISNIIGRTSTDLNNTGNGVLAGNDLSMAIEIWHYTEQIAQQIAYSRICMQVINHALATMRIRCNSKFDELTLDNSNDLLADLIIGIFDRLETIKRYARGIEADLSTINNQPIYEGYVNVINDSLEMIDDIIFSLERNLAEMLGMVRSERDRLNGFLRGEQPFSNFIIDNLEELFRYTSFIKRRLMQIKEKISQIENSTQQLYGELPLFYGFTTYISGDISNIYGKNHGFRGNVDHISGSLEGIEDGDVSNISGNVSTMNGNVEGLSGDIEYIYGNVSAMDGNMTGKIGFSRCLTRRIVGITEDVSDIEIDCFKEILEEYYPGIRRDNTIDEEQDAVAMNGISIRNARNAYRAIADAAARVANAADEARDACHAVVVRTTAAVTVAAAAVFDATGAYYAATDENRTAAADAMAVAADAFRAATRANELASGDYDAADMAFVAANRAATAAAQVVDVNDEYRADAVAHMLAMTLES